MPNRGYTREEYLKLPEEEKYIELSSSEFERAEELFTKSLKVDLHTHIYGSVIFEWNEEKLNQVIGRAIRHKSHAHLRTREREVTVQRYLTYPSPGILRRMVGSKPMGVEQALYNLSQSKTELNKELLGLLNGAKK